MKKSESDEKFLILVGSYTEGDFAKDVKGDGLSCLIFDPNLQTVQLTSVFNEWPNLSYLLFDQSEKFIYAVTETDNAFGKKNTGALISLELNQQNFSVKMIDAIESNGESPCHISVNEQNNIILISNYYSGSLCVIASDKTNGKFIKTIDTIQLKFDGQGPVLDRQNKSYAHCSKFHPSTNLLYVVDLGGDKIHIFTIDEENSIILPWKQQPFLSLEPGSGPRHITISSDGKFLYCLSELKNKVSVCAIKEGSLLLIQEIATISETFKTENYGAEIKIHPNNRLLFISNRGFDVITSYSIDQSTGLLKLLNYQPTLGIFYCFFK